MSAIPTSCSWSLTRAPLRICSGNARSDEAMKICLLGLHSLSVLAMPSSEAPHV
jgi:hypothetical protein